MNRISSLHPNLEWIIGALGGYSSKQVDWRSVTLFASTEVAAEFNSYLATILFMVEGMGENKDAKFFAFFLPPSLRRRGGKALVRNLRRFSTNSNKNLNIQLKCSDSPSPPAQKKKPQKKQTPSMILEQILLSCGMSHRIHSLENSPITIPR